MSTSPQSPQGSVGILIPTVPSAPRHALGWPPGSIRAVLALMVVGLVCALLLLSSAERPIPLPAYLLYLLFLILGHYFTARSRSAAHAGPQEAAPLGLPSGFVRLTIVAALVATLAWKLQSDRAGLQAQFEASVDALKAMPFLPVVVLGGFLLGVLVRMVVGRGERAAWFQDLEAWLSLIAVLSMAVATLIHLVIDPSLSERLHMPEWEGYLAGFVAFYFGERS